MIYQLDLSREEVLGSIVRVIEKHSDAFRSIYKRYCRGGSSNRHPEGEKRVTEEEFLRFAKDFKLCHGVLSRVQLQRIFRMSATIYSPPPPPKPPAAALYFSPIQPPGLPSPRQVRFLGLAYLDFLVALGHAAVLLFSGPEWDKQHPEVGQKLQLLLFRMDHASAIFVGNGYDLLQHVLHNPVTFRDLTDKSIQPLSMLPRHPRLDSELRDLYARYCSLGARLNCGMGACMSRVQFRSFLHDTTITTTPPPLTSRDLDLILAKVFARHTHALKKLSYDLFYATLGQIALRKFPQYTAKRAGVALYLLIVQYILPSASRMAAEQCQEREREEADALARGAAAVRVARWRQRWHDIENLRYEIRSSSEVASVFGVTADPAPPSRQQHGGGGGGGGGVAMGLLDLPMADDGHGFTTPLLHVHHHHHHQPAGPPQEVGEERRRRKRGGKGEEEALLPQEKTSRPAAGSTLRGEEEKMPAAATEGLMATTATITTSNQRRVRKLTSFTPDGFVLLSSSSSPQLDNNSHNHHHHDNCSHGKHQHLNNLIINDNGALGGINEREGQTPVGLLSPPATSSPVTHVNNKVVGGEEGRQHGERRRRRKKKGGAASEGHETEEEGDYCGPVDEDTTMPAADLFSLADGPMWGPTDVAMVNSTTHHDGDDGTSLEALMAMMTMQPLGGEQQQGSATARVHDGGDDDGDDGQGREVEKGGPGLSPLEPANLQRQCPQPLASTASEAVGGRKKRGGGATGGRGDDNGAGSRPAATTPSPSRSRGSSSSPPRGRGQAERGVQQQQQSPSFYSVSSRQQQGAAMVSSPTWKGGRGGVRDRLGEFWKAQSLEVTRSVAAGQDPFFSEWEPTPWSSFFRHHCGGQLPAHDDGDGDDGRTRAGGNLVVKTAAAAAAARSGVGGKKERAREHHQRPRRQAPRAPFRRRAGDVPRDGDDDRRRRGPAPVAVTVVKKEPPHLLLLLEEATNSLRVQQEEEAAGERRQQQGEEVQGGGEQRRQQQEEEDIILVVSPTASKDDHEGFSSALPSGDEEEEVEEEGGGDGGGGRRGPAVSMLPDGFETTVPVLVMPPQPHWIRDDDDDGSSRGDLSTTWPIQIQVRVASTTTSPMAGNSTKEKNAQETDQGTSSSSSTLYFHCRLSRPGATAPSCSTTIDAVTWKERYEGLSCVPFTDGPSHILKLLQEAAQTATTTTNTSSEEGERGHVMTTTTMANRRAAVRMTAVLIQQDPSVLELKLLRVHEGLSSSPPEEVLALDFMSCDMPQVKYQSQQPQRHSANKKRGPSSSYRPEAW